MLVGFLISYIGLLICNIVTDLRVNHYRVVVALLFAVVRFILAIAACLCSTFSIKSKFREKFINKVNWRRKVTILRKHTLDMTIAHG